MRYLIITVFTEAEEIIVASMTLMPSSVWSQNLTWFFVVSSPEHEVLMVSYCGQPMSVVRRATSVRRAASATALKAYSSYTPGPIA